MKENESKGFIAHSKRFLSEAPSERGSVCWSVSALPEESYCLAEAELIMSDCYKTISLDFGIYSEKTLSERLKKINILIDSLREFRQALEDAEPFMSMPKKEEEIAPPVTGAVTDDKAEAVEG